MEDLKTKVKTRGVSALLEDREQMFTLQELKNACRSAAFGMAQKVTKTANDIEEVVECAVGLAKKRKL